MIYIVNRYKHKPTENDFYIGRGSVLGNPYTHRDLNRTIAQFQCKTREEAIDRYRTYITDLIKNEDFSVRRELRAIVQAAIAGKDVYLVCYCKPKTCHGDILREIIEKIVENKIKKDGTNFTG